VIARAFAAAALLAGCAPEPFDARWEPAEDRAAPLAVDSQLLPATPLAGEPTALRIATYNVELGVDPEALAAVLDAPPFDRADAVLIQEIESSPGDGASQAARVAELTGMAHVYLPSRSIDGGGTFGMAILARRPLANVRVMDLPFFGTSLRRDRLVALAVDMQGIDVVNVHLRVQLGIAERIVQLEPATRDLAPLAILGGDLNTNPYAWSDMIPVVPSEPITDVDVPAIVDAAMAELGGFDAPTAGAGPTQRSPAGELRLDSIYSRGFEAIAARVERSVDGSDHWPLWIDLRRE
jgi:endonuclease/exonuclease/phosphatase family metal-dependent hydrolase